MRRVPALPPCPPVRSSVRHRGTRRAAGLTVVVVAATGLAVATPAIAAGRSSGPAPHAVAPTQHSTPLARVDAAGAALAGALAAPSAGVARASARSALAAKPSSALATAALTPAVAVPSGISVVGATWPEGAMPSDARLMVRTSTHGSWSAWQALDSDDGHDPDPGTAEAAHERGGTQPYVVTDASAVQVRLDTASGTAPAGATVDVVDPGTSDADASAGTATAGAAQAAAAQPTIYSRKSWGADEKLRKGTVEYGAIQAAFVHHTVSENNYSAGQVPAIIRGIYAFHVNGRGWNDIGYNFLVDRFGRIWEGRYGGIALPVVGAHTRNYNSNSFAMSAIGNFDVAHVPSAIVSAYQRLFAWKLSLHGVPATGKVTLNGNSINRISGHRDVGSTACPGRYLYALLPQIRSGTASRMGTLPAAGAGSQPGRQRHPRPAGPPARWLVGHRGDGLHPAGRRLRARRRRLGLGQARPGDREPGPDRRRPAGPGGPRAVDRPDPRLPGRRHGSLPDDVGARVGVGRHPPAARAG